MKNDKEKKNELLIQRGDQLIQRESVKFRRALVISGSNSVTILRFLFYFLRTHLAVSRLSVSRIGRKSLGN